jgi:hypothetical protein
MTASPLSFIAYEEWSARAPFLIGDKKRVEADDGGLWEDLPKVELVHGGGQWQPGQPVRFHRDWRSEEKAGGTGQQSSSSQLRRPPCQATRFGCTHQLMRLLCLNVPFNAHGEEFGNTKDPKQEACHRW